ncbi:WD40 repeat-like protein [Fomitiporia mediterranea MF3/22]|uniref:WD40 repeat-like protein n=1 Tax=Fomitiporia mediterranea (strain MF3/22) TaxID=694068 RepID=UPI00044092F8|nr:WD40 repeat-like protein [Fomitiporia mediterranea MF3/22]EJD01960.1 WD40 repeat-like protein [Fomitiporia mediterranea MF3/22]
MAEPAATLPVLFTTHTPYPLPAQKFMIPASWKRYQLSQLVNKALSLSQPIPFDFILKKTGELLRGSLQEWSEATGVGTEETLEIEYVESLLPPTRIAGMPHDDWVSDVSCGMQGHFVTANYDGLLRVFDSSQSLVHTISGHNAAVTSVCTISSTPDGLGRSNDVIVASASHDRTARLTSYNPDSKTSRALASLHLHTSPISSILSSPDGEHLLTAGWDNLIGLWDSKVPSSDETDASSTDEPKSRKRRRLATGNGSSEAKRKAPSAVLKSHTGRVTAAIFSSTDGKRAYSASLDATVRTWDIDTEICLHTHTVTEAPFLALVHLSAPHLLAASSTDRTVRIIDTRTFTSTSSSLDVSPPIILQHVNTPACLAASPTSSHHVASGGYDGVVRVWDVRSAKSAIASFRAGEGVDAEKRGDAKVLGLDWRSGVMAVAGEAGLDIWRVPERAEEAR